MSLKQKVTALGFFFLLIIVALFITLASIYFYLPTHVASKLIPKIAQKVGIQNYACDVRRIGLFGADIGGIRIGTDKHPMLSIASVQIDYSPRGLYKKTVKRTTLSGIELFCKYQNGEFYIQNLSVKNLIAGFQSSEKTTSSSTGISQTVSIERLEIRNSVVVFEYREKIFRLPIELEITPLETGGTDTAGNGFKGILRLYPRNQKIVFAASIHIVEKQIVLKMDASKVQLDRFADLTRLIPGLSVSGKVNINGKASFYLQPFDITSASVLFQFRDPEFTYNNLAVNDFQIFQTKKRPLKIEINKTGKKEWEIFGSAVSIVSPLPVQMADIKCKLKILEDAIAVSGKVNIESRKVNTKTSVVNILQPFNIKGHYFLEIGKDGKWNFRMHHAPKHPYRATPKTCGFQIHGIEIVSNLPVIDVSGKGEHLNGTVTFKLKAPNVNTTANFGTIHLPSISLNGKTRFNNTSKKSRHQTFFKLKASGTTLAMTSTKVTLPMLLFEGELRDGNNHTLNLNTVVKFKDTSLSDSTLKTKIQGISGNIPIMWPTNRTGKEGRFFLKQILWEDRNWGSVTGTLQQTVNGFAFKGEHHNPILKGLSLRASGNIKISSPNDYEAKIHFKTNHYNTSKDIDLGQFFSHANGTTFNGEAVLYGDLFFDPTGIKSPMHIRVDHANVVSAEKDVKIEGIQLSLYLTDLLGLKSAPKQKLQFQNASFGAINITNGEIDFQVESDRSFFIENSRFKWCDGYVYSPAVRISPKTKDYHIILYCDRINLPQILEQLGAVNAEGIGTVNGRLPVQIKNGKIRFQDGFLFSTPGEGGKIHVTGTEVLTAGIPRNTPQYVQIELAREALKDYEFDWARLNLETEGDNALLRLQLDGKPSKPLPFVFNKQIGGFAKVDAGSKGSIFQGIRLDVNFRIPLDKILHYKDILNMIQK